LDDSICFHGKNLGDITKQLENVCAVLAWLGIDSIDMGVWRHAADIAHRCVDFFAQAFKVS